MLGSCSPLHCRLLTLLSGILIIVLATFAGAGICSMLGYKSSQMHDAIIILMLGLGMDDMFVVCNSLDQISLFQSSGSRILRATKMAGPSITITSVTDSLTFLVGATSNNDNVISFCVYCSVSVTMLYLAVLTMFLPILVWETNRVKSRKKECFGLFCCHETKSSIFCKGRFLSDSKRKFSV